MGIVIVNRSRNNVYHAVFGVCTEFLDDYKISVLDAVPDIDMLIFLPEILDGLLCILEGPTMEVRKRLLCFSEVILGRWVLLLRNILQYYYIIVVKQS